MAYIALSLETEYDDNNDSQLMSSEQTLTSFERLVILGDAGQGKTTLLQWLTVHCGRQEFSDEKASWNNKVPVLIKLREVLSNQQLPQPPEFYQLMVPVEAVSDEQQNWLKQVLADKKAIIMIDGYDEVPIEQREQVIQWIEQLCGEYQGNHFILTSRPNAYETNTLKSLDFQEVNLQKMDNPAQQNFISHWHHAMALTIDETQPDALKQTGIELYQQLRIQKSLRTLAENPLLCGVICMLHLNRSGYLPKNKAQLYEATSKMFLDSRDSEKKIIEDERFKQLDYVDKMLMLADIAFWMTEQKRTSISYAQLVKLLDDILNNRQSAISIPFNEQERASKLST